MTRVHAVKPQKLPSSPKDNVVNYPTRFNIGYIELINKDFPLAHKFYIFDVNVIQAIEAPQDRDETYTTVYLSNGVKYTTTMPYQELIGRMVRLQKDN